MKYTYLLAAVIMLSSCVADHENNTSVVPEGRVLNPEISPPASKPLPEFLAKNESELSIQDSEIAYEMCVRALSNYYQAVWNGSDIDLKLFIKNENLMEYMEKKSVSQYEVYGKFNDKVQSVDINDWEVQFKDDATGGFLYLKLLPDIKKSVGSYGEPTEFLVRNEGGKLVIVDWYSGSKDTYDFMVRGENLTIDNPSIWNDDEWVKEIFSKQTEFSSTTR